MLIATIVFGPFIGAAAAAAIGKRHEKAGEYAALFLTVLILGLTLVLCAGAETGTLYPGGGDLSGPQLPFTGGPPQELYL